VVTSFIIPTSATSLTVGITALTATDNIGVTGYMVTETSAIPAASATGWTAAAPTSHTFASAGAKTLYAWAKDGAGNVSTSLSKAITISVGDTVRPVVTSFQIPQRSESLTIAILDLKAKDNIAVTGYLLTETSTKPTAAAKGWKSMPPASYTFRSNGVKTLYGWAKDRAGNVSAPIPRRTTIHGHDRIDDDVREMEETELDD
jgi:hypothetical protein